MPQNLRDGRVYVQLILHLVGAIYARGGICEVMASLYSRLGAHVKESWVTNWVTNSTAYAHAAGYVALELSTNGREYTLS